MYKDIYDLIIKRSNKGKILSKNDLKYITERLAVEFEIYTDIFCVENLKSLVALFFLPNFAGQKRKRRGKNHRSLTEKSKKDNKNKQYEEKDSIQSGLSRYVAEFW